jgi:MFS family permease
VVINGYTMALAALLLPIGAIGDRWGRKPILLGGLVLFAAANTLPVSPDRWSCCSSHASSRASARR